MSSHPQRAALFEQLDSLGISHTTHEHKAVFTVEESAEIKANLPGGHTKNLFLKDKNGQFFLICALGDTQVPVNKLHRIFECKRLSFGKPEPLLEHLGVTPGSVTFFAIMNDTKNQVKLVLDKALFDHDIVNFHPMENTATTAIAADDLIIFAKAVDHDPVILDFSTVS
ncbi:MAG: prolyl-tRNA synthetase associated domain-containing protein [Acidimicrobiales bacterium]|nr:MAG: prolyl-tRNA synthetase associated domain-containing protein [Acidimicrobiales bacterium]